MFRVSELTAPLLAAYTGTARCDCRPCTAGRARQRRQRGNDTRATGEDVRGDGRAEEGDTAYVWTAASVVPELLLMMTPWAESFSMMGMTSLESK
jgi:hypothetical protein